jgi:cytochrome c nitrite reductase small subunit
VPAISRKTLAIALGLTGGILTGAGLYTAQYSKAGSYLTNDPEACANCHVMQEQYAGWMKGSHRKAAVCNDCHAPHTFVPKYATKALNGFFHSWAFTTGRFPDVIRITERNRRVTEGACLHCHESLTSAIHQPGKHEVSCLRCHSGVGHGGAAH